MQLMEIQEIQTPNVPIASFRPQQLMIITLEYAQQQRFKLHTNHMDYPHLLLLFYRKVAARHPARHLLLRTLHTIIQKVEHVSENQVHLKKQVGEGFTFKKERAKEDVMKRKQAQWGCEWIFVGKSIQKCLLFSVLHHIFAKEDFIGFRFLEDKLNASIEEWQINEEILRKVGQGWIRISGLFVKKNGLRWEKLLEQIVQHLPDELDELIQKMFVKTEGYDKQKMLAETSLLFRLTLHYSELQGRKVIKQSKYGMAQQRLYITFLQDLGQYTVSKHLPQLSTENKEKENVMSQLRAGFNFLLEQYEQGTIRLEGLSSLQTGKAREGKVLAYLNRK